MVRIRATLVTIVIKVVPSRRKCLHFETITNHALRTFSHFLHFPFYRPPSMQLHFEAPRCTCHSAFRPSSCHLLLHFHLKFLHPPHAHFKIYRHGYRPKNTFADRGAAHPRCCCSLRGIWPMPLPLLNHSELALFAQRTRMPTSARSIGFCAIWVYISSSSSLALVRRGFNEVLQAIGSRRVQSSLVNTLPKTKKGKYTAVTEAPKEYT